MRFLYFSRLKEKATIVQILPKNMIENFRTYIHLKIAYNFL